MDKATPTPSPATPIQVTVLKPSIWMESGMAGDWHIMVQYADDAPFEYAALFYRYGYTDNATIHRAATEIAISIGASEPVEERQRPLRAEVERLAAQAAPTERDAKDAARDDAALYQTIGERDNYHKWADRLADGIATHLSIDIGEHTAGMGSAESNNPWVNALEAIQSAAQPACPNCGGSGCVQQMTGHLGPDDYEETVDCPHCNGNQTLDAAYLGVFKSLKDEREAHSRTRSIIWGWTSSRSEVNAVQHKLGNILEHLKPSNIAWVADRLRDLIASAVTQSQTMAKD